MEPSVEIVIEPGHTSDSLDTDLSSLATDLAAKVPEASFYIVPKELVGRGLTWWEVILIYIPVGTIAKAAIEAVLDETVRWLRERFKKVPKRPKYVAIYGPDGKVIKSVVLHSPTGEPKDRTNDDLQKPPRFPP